MPDSPPSPGDSDATVPDVMAAFQMLRAAQDAEARAIETLLLYQVHPQQFDVDTATASLDRAIAQHRAAGEELTALRAFRPRGDEEQA